MDDESAEIELLEQNLNKTRQISQRMTAILASFDTRLAKLEKSIRPLYDSTQILNRRANNIEKALLKIDEVASNQEGIAAEEALILKGPQIEDLNTYKDALERLNASIVFKTADRDSRDTARLIETGAKKLTLLYTKLVAEASTGSLPVPGADAVCAFPPSLLVTLVTIVGFLRTLPLPSTHPSHPAAQIILATLKDAQRGYADMRGTWARKCLEVQGKRVVDRADNMDGVAAGRELGKWVANLLTVAESEYQYLLDLAPLQTPSDLALTYNNFLAPLLTLFSNTNSALLALIKRSLHRHTFLVLSSFDSLAPLLPRWEDIHARCGDVGNSASGTRRDELRDGVHALRAVCLRSFPELLADIRATASGKTLGPDTTSIADFAVSTVDYLNRLPEVLEAVSIALLTLGDGNWKMGEGVTLGRTLKPGEGDKKVIVEHFTFDVITTLVSSLSTLSRVHKRPALGSIFLLNNVAYLLRHIVISPRSPALLNHIPKPAIDLLNSSFRTAKAGYYDLNFAPLLQTLTEDSKERAVIATGRSSTKEKLTKFFDLLEEVTDRHKLARVLDDEPEWRDQVADEAVKLVVPILQRYTQRQKDKNPQKYMKGTVDDVEAQIRSFFGRFAPQGGRSVEGMISAIGIGTWSDGSRI